MAELHWRIAAASVAGASHVASGTTCQDAHVATLRASSQDVVIAVSDGAGSARAAEAGARIAVEAIRDQAEAWLSGGGTVGSICRERAVAWLTGVRDEIARRALEAESEASDFACTLLFAIVGDTASAFAQIGDGAIVVATEDKKWSPVVWPQHGPYVNTTYFVTDDEALDRLVFVADLGTVLEIAVFTDGLERLVLNFNENTGHPPFFNRMMLPLRGSTAVGYDETLSQFLAEYLRSPTVTSRTDDDLTLVLASRQPGATAPETPVIAEFSNAGSARYAD